MKRIFLLRHAKSSWDDPSLEDIERPLNKRGRRAARAMAVYFRAKNLAPSIVLCSTAVRTRETLDHLRSALDGADIQYDDRIYDAVPQTLLARLRELPEECQDVLLIGHNPGLERLARGLAGKGGNKKAADRLEDKYPTGALTILSFDGAPWAALTTGNCRLEAFVCPSDLEED